MADDSGGRDDQRQDLVAKRDDLEVFGTGGETADGREQR